MSDMETSDLHQKAVLWTINGTDDDGENKVNAAVEISIRWQFKHGEVLDPNGNPIAFDTVAIVDQTLSPGDILWLGALADVASPPINLRQVLTYEEVPDVKNRVSRRRITMMKHGDTLPTLA